MEEGQSSSGESNANRIFFGVMSASLAALAGVGYFQRYRLQKNMHTIQNTPQISISELERTLDRDPTDSFPGEVPRSFYIKVTGLVHSDFPIPCEHTTDEGAIHEKKVIGVGYSFFDGRNHTDEFVSETQRRYSRYYIHEGKESSKIYIDPFIGQPELECVHTHEEKNGNFLLSVICRRFGIKYAYKLKHTESILPLDRELLAIGNVTKQRNGTILLSEPQAKWFNLQHPGVLSLKVLFTWVWTQSIRKKNRWLKR
eukprot:TRINITY_DN11305_c0_g1_i1.p1 TRINITY_DN11305_c0_g1~~TRINITY_DN11305_c0_g1_i1.p1  ORF type:complete len:256 (+),score=14.30 TRINITY_DN11305_c0_g1_i1:38-805(+)